MPIVRVQQEALEVRVWQRGASERRCPLCQDQLIGGLAFPCACGVRYHRACADELGGKCIPGCERELRSSFETRPVRRAVDELVGGRGGLRSSSAPRRSAASLIARCWLLATFVVVVGGLALAFVGAGPIELGGFTFAFAAWLLFVAGTLERVGRR